MKIAFAAIIKGDEDEAALLLRLLGNVHPYIDGIFITVTHQPGEIPNQATIEAAQHYNAQVSTFEWKKDFALARNFNFSQVPQDYDYILWADADDQFRGLDKLRPTIEEHPADAYIFNYLYAFDEWKNPIVVHAKTQVVKNDNCVEWVGQLHEDFKEHRSLTSYFIKGIERLHLSDDARFSRAKERNEGVARHQVELYPNDPRSYWNLGNSLKSNGKPKEALEAFDKFLESSESDDEKYIVRLRRAEIFWELDQKDKAIDEARYGIGIKPEYPDAYHLLGKLYFESNRLQDAAKMYIGGLTKKPPYYSIIVYNPRDYDYVPMMNLAKVYFALNLPQLALPLLEGCSKIVPKDESLKEIIRAMKKESRKADKVLALISKLQKIKDKEKLKVALNKVPDEFKSHPGICNIRNVNFIKTESTGKELVFFCGFTEEVWTPNTAKRRGIGGSEEAVIHLSQRLAQKGWQVTVYNNCGHKEQKFGDVTYKPFWAWNYRDKVDVTIIWRHPKTLDYEINSPAIYVDLHDVIQDGEFTKPRVNKTTKVFVKSNFHRSLFPSIPDEKIVVIPNGLDTKVFTQSLERDSKLLINTSSPDRSLSTLIRLFKRVKEQVPDAKCQWAYGWKVFDSANREAKQQQWKENILRQMEEAGIENLGRLSHSQIAQLYLTANIFAYPTEFGEIHCISAAKAQAAGAIPVTTDFAALDETVQFGHKVHSLKTKDDWAQPYQFDFSLQNKEAEDEWVRKVVEVLQNPPSEQDRYQMREWACERYDWDLITNQWNELLSIPPSLAE